METFGRYGGGLIPSYSGSRTFCILLLCRVLVQFDSIIGLVCNLLFEGSHVCFVTVKTWSTESCASPSIFVSWRKVSAQCLQVKQKRASCEGMRVLQFDSPSISPIHK